MSRIFTNAVSAFAESLLLGLILFVQYMYLTRTIGLELLGGWAILVSIANTAQLGQIGLAATPVRFVSRFRGKGDLVAAALRGRTAIVTVALLMGALLLAMMPFVDRVINWFMSSEIAAQLSAVMPVTFFGAWLLICSASIQSCLEGFERIDLRAVSAVSGATVQLAAIVFLVPRYQILGMAVALTLNGLTILILSLYFSGRYTSLLDRTGPIVSLSALREMLSYAVNLQLITATKILIVPATKLMIATFGNLPAVAIFEIANRFTFQVRQLLAATNRTLVPVFSRVESECESSQMDLYGQANEIFSFLAYPVFCLVAISSFAMSIVVFDASNLKFVTYTYVISAACVISTICGPAYFANLGLGRPGRNVIGHSVTAAINIILGFSLGYTWGASGVVIGYAMSLAVGPALVLFLFLRSGDAIPFDLPWPRVSLTAVTSLGLAAIAPLAWEAPQGLSIFFHAIFVMIITMMVWIHPIGRNIRGYFLGSRVAE